MPKHPEDTPSEFHENPEDWTPEKERKQDPSILMERALKMMDRAEASQDEAQAGRVIGALDYFPHQHQISIRRINNGYVMTYFEAKEINRGPAIVNVPGAFFPKQVEVFISGPTDAQPHLVEALKHAELLAQSAALIEKVAAEQMKLAGRHRGARPISPFVTGPRSYAAVDPPPPAPDEETKKLEDPPPASPA